VPSVESFALREWRRHSHLPLWFQFQQPPVGSVITSEQRDVMIIGASLAGLFAAAAGARIMIIERDVLPDGPLPRKGVPQGRQPHVQLPRGLLAAEELLPGIREDLLSHGAVPFDTGTMAWLGEYGWLPTWIAALRRSRRRGRCWSIWYVSGCDASLV
jgi:2-polyprenyl-6-methoxyphenol hydroxylase-like FAD-dependent oxidoreductase